MIICSIGHGYVANFLFKELCSLGALGLGVSSKKFFINNISSNFRKFNRDEVANAVSYSTHLIVTAPANGKGCPVFKNYYNLVVKSNIKSITYISTTGVYGNHNGKIVDEKSLLKAKHSIDRNRILAEKQWANFSKENHNMLNIIRMAGIYGPDRVNSFKKTGKKYIVRKEHYFSRIHILDAARAITKILLETNGSEVWNFSDNFSSTREDFLLEIVKLKRISNYDIINFKQYESNLSKKAKKFWLNNKKVSNHKLKKKLRYYFLFPSYKSGLKSLKCYL